MSTIYLDQRTGQHVRWDGYDWSPVATPQKAGRPWYETAAIGAGGAVTDLGRGLAQRGMQFLSHVGDVSPEQLAAFEAETASRRELMAPIMAEPAGLGGYLAGGVAAGLPLAAVPGANTLAGGAALGGLYGAAMPTVGAESALQNAALGAGLGAAGQVVGQGLSAGARKWLASRQARQTGNAVRDATVREALDAGYRLPPAASNPGSTLNSVLEGLGGKLKTTQRAAQKNQAVSDRLARRALGLGPNAPLTPETFLDVRRTAYAAGYEPITRAGTIRADAAFAQSLADILRPVDELAQDFPDLAEGLRGSVGKVVGDLQRGEWNAKNIVTAIRTYRDGASSLFRDTDPAAIALARTKLQAANLLEELTERNLAASGRTHMLEKFRAARKTIAMAHDVEKATNVATGHVRAVKLGQRLDQGKPLSGELRTIAATERAFRNQGLSGSPLDEMTSSNPAFSPLDSGVGAITGAAGDPRWAGAMLGRPLVRELILSAPYQRLMAQPGGVGAVPTMADNLFNSALVQQALRGVGPMAGLSY
jgi:hypothetical protein